MITDLGDEAKEYGRQALRAFEAAGGDELLQRAEADPTARESIVGPVLAGIGAWDLEPRGDADQLEAAAALCRSAGYWALPYPVAERLSRTADDDGLVVVSGARPSGAVAGVDLNWGTVAFDGRRGRVVQVGQRGPAFVSTLALEPVEGDGSADLPLALVLPCWTLLGMLDRAMELTIGHVRMREQFGQALSGFQSVQFQLTDAEVERAGLEMLAKYATWSVAEGSENALDDALALRMAALEAAEIVFRITHQLHGAVGFCNETTLSWLSRYSQPLRRLPLGVSATRALLTDRLGSVGLTGLFSAAGDAGS